ncbi:MAG: O-methyltransferase [Parvibaculaceae bacterium]
MSRKQWEAVDDYFNAKLGGDDAVLKAALAASDRERLPEIAVTPNQGKFLMLMAQSIGARRILEIGTLGGYSTIWLARALPADGRLVTLEYDEDHARVAKANIAHAGFADRVEIRVGPALASLPKLAGEVFDFAFIDADKSNNAKYFAWALKLARKGSIIIVDNVVRGGAVVDPKRRDEDVDGIHALADLIAKEKRVSATVIQTVGAKGHDGFLMARVDA